MLLFNEIVTNCNYCSLVAENGLLSYENPNYHLDPARLDDALNRNSAVFGPARALSLSLHGGAGLPSKNGYDDDDFTDNRR